ncbi:MAG: hypothetical protein EZS28_041541 [Streblomastix strix]|uniref:Uncharacterized protein n=1 Tax=Streblomastix strix TaxID=222440 RepID=A0A5J4TYW9_9EUKA|nr:MAG: hypothetical protein EZS28_041541 [Streblomastix strix]
MIQSSSLSSSTQGQGSSGSGNQLIAGIRNRRVYEDIYKKGSDEYLPYNVKNQGRYMGFIRRQPKTRTPGQKTTFENITARVGNRIMDENRKAQQRALADQVGSGLINIVGRLAKDIKRVKALVNEQSAQNWIKDRGLKDQTVQTDDLDLYPNAPKNVIVTSPSGLYSIDSYRAVGKYLFSKAFRIVLKSMGHAVDENHGKANQALCRIQQLSFL